MTSLRVLVFLFISFCSTSWAFMPMTGQENPRLQTFQQQFLKLMRNKQMTGAAVAMMYRGNLIYARGFGWADLEKKKLIYPDSLFRIASISKTITAVTILKLVELQILSLDTPVNSILNLMPLGNKKINPATDKITIGNLLNMTSGWAGGQHRGFDPLFGRWPQRWLEDLGLKPPVDCQTAARFMLSRGLIARPGTAMSYANVNYCVLGLVINKLAMSSHGENAYEKYIQQQILEPLGINDMRIAATDYQNKLPKEVTYYPRVGIAELPYSDTNILAKNFADGGWLASAVDLAKFGQALHQGYIINHGLLHKMIEKPARVPYLSSSKKNLKRYYGMGWFVFETPIGKVWVTHGSFTGSHSLLICRPDGLITAYLFNKKPSYWGGLETFRRQLFNLTLQVPVH